MRPVADTGERDAMATQANPDETRGRGAVFALCLVTGTLMALSVGAGVRLYHGHAPGVTPRPYAELLGRKMPVMELPGLSGGTVSLPSDEHGTRHVLYFTDSGCKACDRAYPLLGAWPFQEVPVLVVAMGLRDSVRVKLERNDIAMATAFDSTRRAATAYGVHAFPSALLLDEDGRVLAGAFGSAALTVIREALAAGK